MTSAKKMCLRVAILLSFLVGSTIMALNPASVLEYHLENGLTVFLIQDPSASFVSVRTYVRTGSIDEAPLLGSGLSHYLEHLLAGGTTHFRTEETYRKLITSMGGAYNAYTTTDHTCYYINTLPKDVFEATSILHEWMFYNTFPDKEYNREKEVITREIEKGEASIGRSFYQICQENFYKFNAIRYPVIGYLENFKAVQKNQLMDYYKSRYIPSNMALVIGGNIEPVSLLEHIKKTFGKEKRIAPPKVNFLPEPLPFSSRYQAQEGDTHVTYFSIRFPSIDIASPDLYPLDLLDFILGHGEDSLLHKTIVEDKKLAYSVHTNSYTPTTTTGYFDISFEIDLKNKEAVEKAVFEIIEDIRKGKLDSKRIERAKKQKLADDIFSVSTVEDKVEKVGQSFIYGFSKTFYEDYISNFRHVNKDDVIAAAKRYLIPERAIFTVLNPKKEVPPTQNEGTNTLVLTKKPKLVTLDNGLRILLYQDSSLPKVFVKATLLGGIRAETASKNGVGYLTSDLIGKQSKKYSKDAIHTLIEGNGAHLGGSLGNNTFTVSLDCLSEDFSSLLPVFFDTLLNPVFKADDCEESKRKVLKRITQRKDDWFSYGSYEFRKNFFAPHPYSLSLLGEKNTIKPLQPDDIKTFYKSLINPSQMVLSVFGDFDEQKTLAQLNKNLASIKTVPTSNLTLPIERPLHSKKSTKHFEVPQDIGAIFFGFDGEKVSNKDLNIELDLLDCVLTGSHYPGGRLHTLLREKGLVYVVHGGHNPGLEPGAYTLYALTNPNQLEEVESLILKTIDDIKNKDISDEEFKEALSQLDFYYKDRSSSLEALSTITSTDELFNNGYDYFTKIENKLRLLSKDDVKNAAKKYLNHPQVYIFKSKKDLPK